jgi:NADH-quinone oxidoreductase subunit D
VIAQKDLIPVDNGGDPTKETFVLNLGPQHPAAHGVLRVLLTMDGEWIQRAEPVIGYIHRMHEKMGENRTWAKFLPNTSRIDYLSAMHYTHAFVGAVERAAKIEVPVRAEYARVITSELNRISSHMVWWGALLLDLGGFTPILYAFDDREKILDLLEALCGARLTYCYYRFGGLYNDVDDAFLKGTRDFVAHMKPRLKMYRELVTDNIILRKRLTGIGPLSADLCRRYGATGPVIRGAGVPYDVRRAEPYSVYPKLEFKIPTYPEATRWRATSCAWTRWSRACSSSSRPSTRFRPDPSSARCRACSSSRSATPATRSRPRGAGSWSASSATAKRFPTA